MGATADREDKEAAIDNGKRSREGRGTRDEGAVAKGISEIEEDKNKKRRKERALKEVVRD